MLSKDLLANYRKQGFIIGPNESEENFLQRVHICKDSLPERFFPISSPKLFNKNQILTLLTHNSLYQHKKYAILLATFSWMPIFVSNYKLPFWIGGVVWICSEDNVAVPILQLRRPFKKRSRINLYSPVEICMHEALHAMRTSFEEPKFEEFLAYSTSPNTLHKRLGPLFQTSFESTIFLICLLLGSFGSFFSFLATLPFFIYLSFLILRLCFRHKAMFNCIKNIENLFPHIDAFSVTIHLTDKEIWQFSKMSLEELSLYIRSQSCLRWRQISTLLDLEN